MKRRHYFITGICLLCAYICTYAYLYANARPAANAAYFVFLKGGGPEVQRREQIVLFLLPGIQGAPAVRRMPPQFRPRERGYSG